MKIWKWIVALVIILSFGTLIGSSLLIEKYLPLMKFPENWGNDSARWNQAFLERPGALVSSIGALFTLCLIGVLIVYVIPDRIRLIADSVPNKPQSILRLTFTGFLVEVVVLAIGISSALMIGTFPLTILLVGSLFLVGLTGYVSLGFALGRTLIRKAGWLQISPLFALILGELILFALVRIPILGGILLVLFSSLGLGVTITSHFGSGKNWNLNSLTEEVTK